MKSEHKKFCKKLKKFLKAYPEQRITQGLFNLGVTFKKDDTPNSFYTDNYNQEDDLTLSRMKESLKTIKKLKQKDKNNGKGQKEQEAL